MTIEPNQHASHPVPVQPSAPAGWYPDAASPDILRYWDGRLWTQQTAPTSGVPHLVTQAPSAPRKSMTAAYLLLVFLGGYGAHRFYLGRTWTALAQLLLLVGGWLLTALAFFLSVVIVPRDGLVAGVAMLVALYAWLIVDLFLTVRMVNQENARA